MQESNPDELTANQIMKSPSFFDCITYKKCEEVKYYSKLKGWRIYKDIVITVCLVHITN